MPPLCSRSPSPPSSGSSSSSHRRARHVAPLVAGMTAIAIATTRRDGGGASAGYCRRRVRSGGGFGFLLAQRRGRGSRQDLAARGSLPPPLLSRVLLALVAIGEAGGLKIQVGVSQGPLGSSGGYSGVRPFLLGFSFSPACLKANEAGWLSRSSAMKSQWRLVGFSRFTAKLCRPPSETCGGGGDTQKSIALWSHVVCALWVAKMIGALTPPHTSKRYDLGDWNN